jgi:hypothetical protein
MSGSGSVNHVPDLGHEYSRLENKTERESWTYEGLKGPMLIAEGH